MTEPLADVRLFATPDAFEAWLEAHPDAVEGVWIRFVKKGSSLRTASYEQLLDVALRHGWIDSQVRALDAESYAQRFTPRRVRSPWSRRNREKAEAFIAAGLMRPAGLAEVERARADGRWERAYDRPSEAQTPPDFLAALAANPGARAFFETLDAHNRYAIYFRLQGAKRPETRARRIEQVVAMLARGERFHGP
jgi:uncharacterized protein YdeI (YjbR/CyaY-like superfamily)